MTILGTEKAIASLGKKRSHWKRLNVLPVETSSDANRQKPRGSLQFTVTSYQLSVAWY
ncbi:MAG: hypothetical protein VKK42_00235 [Lyngbya sp.]|nr:hypothetical protein [Lyngbya sp.]